MAYRIILNKIENELVSLKNISSLCCGDRGRSRDVWQSHSPMQLKPLEAGDGGGGSWCLCFYVLLARCCWSVVGCWLWVGVLVTKVRLDTYHSNH